MTVPQELTSTRAATRERITTGSIRTTLAVVTILSVWLGAVLFFIAVVAPAAFSALPTRTLAGALVGRTLPAIFYAGVVAGILVLVLAVASGPAAARRGAQLVGGGIVALLCFVGQVVIGGRIDRVMAGVGGALDALPAGDPTRVEFGRLHALSVVSLGLAALVALAMLWLALGNATRRRPTDT